jgi:rhamnogalacturonan endolyase
MQAFHEEIVFRDSVDPRMRPGFRLSNWPNETWEVEDNLLWQRRSRVDEYDERIAYRTEHYGDGPSWIKIPRAPYPALVIGDREWVDYTVTTKVRVSSGGRAGLAVRWEDGRHCYYVFLEHGRELAAYRRLQDELIELARAEFEHTSDEFYTLTVEAKGASLACSIENGPTLEITDDHYTTGGVALLAEAPAEYEHLTIDGTCQPADLPTLPTGVMPRKQMSIPLPDYDSATALRPALRQAGGEPLIILRPNESRELSLVGPDGREHCRLGPWDQDPGSVGDFPVQVFDLNGDGQDEVIVIVDGKIRVHDLAGQLLAEKEIPPPNAYGECANDPEWATVNDALCPVEMGDGKLGLYIKDRYWNIHFYDSDLNHRWHHAVNTGHYPFPVDLDDDGRQDILCGHTLFDVDGNILWKADLPDHADGAAFLSLREGEPKRLYLTAGEAGLVCLDPATGEILERLKLGHIQHGWFGRFIDGQSRDILVITLWCENNIYYLLDDQLREVARWELDLTDNSYGPSILPWGDRDVLAGGSGPIDPMTGRYFSNVDPWPLDEELLGQWVVDWPGAGPSRLVQLFADRIDIYEPTDGCIRRATPMEIFSSGYLPHTETLT